MSFNISRQKAGLALGPVLFLLILLSDIEGMSWEAKSIAASTVWIACWWLTEAIPIPATSLLPIILFPLLGALEIGKLKEITFMQWAYFGVPLAFFILIVCWAYLVYVAYPPKIKALGNGIEEEILKLGKITVQEKRVLAVFLLVASLWVTRAMWGKYLPLITDSSIAIFGAFLLFLIPSGKNEALLKWNDALRLPWDVVLLLGGGLAIAKGFMETGLDAWIASHLLILKGMPAIAIILAVVTIIIFLTEITSNTATATPPNAIVFGTGYVTIPQMARAGLWMNIICIAIITLFITFMLH